MIWGGFFLAVARVGGDDAVPQVYRITALHKPLAVLLGDRIQVVAGGVSGQMLSRKRTT